LPRALLVTAALLMAACAPRPIALPTGAGVPFPEYAVLYEEVTLPCRGIRTFTAELSLAGRAGDTRLRGRVQAGFERPGSLRFTAVAPFGPPIFVFVAAPDTASLLLPRENRLLLDAPPEAIVEALTGFALDPDDLRAILTGCVEPDARPVGARAYGRGWIAVDLESRATAFVRPVDRRHRITAATRGPLIIEYGEFVGGRPSRVRLLLPADRNEDSIAADLTVRLSQVSINVDLPPEAFSMMIPPGVLPLSLAELRRLGPLGEF
jgi:hypothetical protein